MSTSIGFISSFSGEVVITHANGIQESAEKYAQIFEDDVVATAAIGSVEIVLDSGNVINLGANDTVFLDAMVVDGEELEVSDTSSSKSAIEDFLAEIDLNELEDTAAGVEDIGATRLEDQSSIEHSENLGYVYADNLDTQTRSSTEVEQNSVDDIRVINANGVEAQSDTFNVDEDTPLLISSDELLLNDVSTNNSTLSIVSFTQAENGTISDNGDGTFTYVANENYNGQDSFTYTVEDANGVASISSVNINVNAINDAPTAEFNQVQTDEDTAITITEEMLLKNISDVENDSLSINSISNPSSGVIIDNDDSTYLYIPEKDFNGVDEFEYSVIDSNGAEVTATLNIGVGFVNDAPVSADDSIIVFEDTPLTLNMNELMKNDSDLDGTLLHVTDFSTPSNGNVVDNGDGTFTYTPSDEYSGSDSFTYTITDEFGATSTSVVFINVISTNDKPLAQDDSITLDEDTSAQFNVLANDSDVDGVISVVSFTQATNGNVVQLENGEFKYTPNANYFGDDSFTYTITDEKGATSSASVSIVVNDVFDAPEVANPTPNPRPNPTPAPEPEPEDTNHAPVAVDDYIDVDMNSTFTSSVDLDANDSDADLDTLQIQAGTFTTEKGGTLVIHEDGSYTYEPLTGFNGVDTFEYSISDAKANDTATLVINVVKPYVEGDGVVLIDAITPDDTINYEESTQDIVVSGRVQNGFIKEGDSVSFVVNGTQYSTTVNEDKTWSVDVKGEDLAADRTFEVKVSSLDDNATEIISSAVSNHSVDMAIESVEDSAIAITATLSDATNSGLLTDTITNDTTPDIVGNTEAGAKVEIFNADVLVGSTTADDKGDYTISLTQELLEGDTTLHVKATDIAGNSAETTTTVTIDTTPPNSASVSVNDITADDIINQAESNGLVIVSGTAIGADVNEGDSINFEVNSTLYSTNVDENGNWSVEVSGADLAADNAFEVNATSADIAGNEVVSSVISTHEVDIVAPSNTDMSNSITFDDTQIDQNESSQVSLSGNVEVDGTINSIIIRDNDPSSDDIVVDASDISVIDGVVSITAQDLSTLSLGDISVEMSVTDKAGNTGSVDSSASLIHTPTILLQESFENLQESAGWHIEKGDVVGDHGAIWDTGTNGLEVQNAVVTQSSDGNVHAELDSSNNSLISTTVTLTDSTDYTLSFDVKPRDGGDSRDNFNTSDIKVSFGAIEVSINSDKDGMLSYESNSNDVIVRSEIDPTTGWNKIVLEYTNISDTTVDVAFEGTGASDSYGMLLDQINLIDTSGEYNDIPVVVTNISTPIVSIDAITLSNDTTPALSGMVDDATAQVVVTINAKEYEAINNGDGTWSIADDIIEALAEGDTLIRVKATDLDGNSAEDSTMISVDTQVISEANENLAITASLADESNSGSKEDTKTSDTTPTIIGNTEAFATVKIYENSTFIGEAKADSDGNYSIEVSTLSEGKKLFEVEATDEAGNSASTTTVLEIDTTNPIVSITDISLTDDTTPPLSGTIDDINAIVVVTINATDYEATNNGDGTWSIADNVIDALLEGDTSVSVKATDDAGNVVTSDGTIKVELSVNEEPIANDASFSAKVGESTAFSLENYATDLEDDADSTKFTQIKIESLPQDGTLFVVENGVETKVLVGEVYAQESTFSYIPNADIVTSVDLGTHNNQNVSLLDWGSLDADGKTIINDGIKISAYSKGEQVEVGFTNDDNSTHDGIGIGVVGSADDGQIESNNGEILRLDFDKDMINMEFGLTGLGGNFKGSIDAKAQWIAYKDTIEVARGVLQQDKDNSDGDNYKETNQFIVDVAFDSIELTTQASQNSNYSLAYISGEIIGEDSLTYSTIDSDGLVSLETGTITFDVVGSSENIPLDAPIVIIENDTNNDGTLNLSEVGNSIVVSIKLPNGAQVGDTLHVDNATTTNVISLTDKMINDALVQTEFDVPTEGSILTINASIQNASGLSSQEGSDSAQVDTIYGDDIDNNGNTLAPFVTIVDPDDNGILDVSELPTTSINGSIGEGALILNTLKVSDTEGNVLEIDTSTIVINTDGSYSVSGVDLSGFSDSILTVVATSEDLDENIISVEDSIQKDGSDLNEKPVAIDEEHSLELEQSALGGNTLNIVLTLDVSGSMKGDRLAYTKEALIEMIENYSQAADINVKIVTFNSSASSSEWLDKAGALSAIEHLSATNSTNYEDALLKTYENYSEPTADSTIAYFISDGEPTSERYDGQAEEKAIVDSPYIDAWETFVNQSVDSLHVVGIGKNLDTTYLDMIADAGGVETTIITDKESLVDTIIVEDNSSVNGNILDNVSGGDGSSTIDSIVIDSVEYKATDYPSGLHVDTLNGAMLLLDFSTGDYTYSVSTKDIMQDVEDIFVVTASDEEGDSVDFNMKFSTDVKEVEASAPELELHVESSGDKTVPISSRVYDDEIHDESYLNNSETYALGDSTQSVTIDFNDFDAGFGILDSADKAKVQLLDGERVVKEILLEEADLDAQGIVTLDADEDFNSIRVSSEQDDFKVHEVSAEVDQTYVVDTNSVELREHSNFSHDNEVSYDLGSYTQSVSINFDDFDDGSKLGDEEDIATVELLSNGVVVKEIELNKDALDANEEVTLSSNVEFNSIKIKATQDNFEVSEVAALVSVINYRYDLAIKASLTDTDEALGNVKIDASSLAQNATLSGDNVTLVNGYYEIDVTSGLESIVQLESNKALSESELKSISASVVSIDQGEVAESTATAILVDTIDDASSASAFESAKVEGSDDLCDVLFLDNNAGMNFDNITTLTQVDVIDLTLGSHALENLTLEDVLDMTDESNELTILGDDKDSVELKDSLTQWQANGSLSENGHTFDIYVNESATVKIEQDINDTIVS